jgi:hypothetical protein
MTDETIAGDVKEFILAHIDSVAQLEALLLLRANPDKLWDATAMARRLYIGEREGQEILAQLCEDGFIRRADNAYRYAPVADTAALITRLADAYGRHLIPVTKIVHQRTGRIREFADAFKLKREP